MSRRVNKISKKNQPSLTLPGMFVLGFCFGKGSAYYHYSVEEEEKRYLGLGRLVAKRYYEKTSTEDS